MLDFRSRILIVAAAGAFLLSSLLNPVFAASTIQIENSTNSGGNFLNFGKDFPFGDGNLNLFFSNFFGRSLEAEMDGVQEVPGPGDVDGRGEATIRLKPNQNQICVDMEVSYIEKATAAHIHFAPPGAAGAVVIALPVPDEEGKSSGCLDIDSNLLKKIQDNPQDYYVNVHNNPFPNGAIRGQLSR